MRLTGVRGLMFVLAARDRSERKIGRDAMLFGEALAAAVGHERRIRGPPDPRITSAPLAGLYRC